MTGTVIFGLGVGAIISGLLIAVLLLPSNKMKTTRAKVSSNDENLTVRLDARFDRCGVCSRDVEEERRLVLTMMNEDGVVKVTICRSCLSEHMPEFLAGIETDLE